LIIGGRYGTTSPDGISYTEKEYDYAVEKGLKVICLIHKNPDAIPAGKTDKDPEMQKKLNLFCEKVKKGRLVKHWEKPEELKALAISGLNYAFRNYPAIGFVRANLVPDENTSSEILKLRNRITELEMQIESISNNAPAGSEKLAQGDDLFEFNFIYKFSTLKPSSYSGQMRTDTSVWKKATAKISWDVIFLIIVPLLVNEANEEFMKEQIDILIYESNYKIVKANISKENEDKIKLSDFSLNDKDFQTIKIQLKSLGLITKSPKNRSVKDKGTYWTLTPYGDNMMTRLIAIRKGK
jgi:hypothetical protein